jgi:RHS repeat-associated protein
MSLTAFTGSGTINAAKGALTPSQVEGIGTNGSNIGGFISGNNSGTNNAKAFLNWVLFDEQMKYVTSGTDPVQTNGGYKLHTAFINAPVNVSRNGFLYVFVSNESNLAVYFDNLAITHTPGAIVEETHYYPFGLTMSGISSKAAVMMENKRKWNKGSELESKEFSDGSGLELYTTFYRSLDPQLGRFWQIDPKPNEAIGPYAAMDNNPILKNDPLGDTAHTNGNAKSISSYLTLLSSATGNKYALDKSGNITRTNKDLNKKNTSKTSAILSNLIETIITDKNRKIELNFNAEGSSKNKGVFVDDYQSATIDVGDAKKIKNPALLAATLAHPLAEYFNAPSIDKRTYGNYKPAHEVATVVESAIVYEMNGSKKGSYGTRTHSFNPTNGQLTLTYGTTSYNLTLNRDSDIVHDVK